MIAVGSTRPAAIGRSTTAGTDWYRDAQRPGRALYPVLTDLDCRCDLKVQSNY